MATMRSLLAGLCMLALNACTVTPPQVHSIIVRDQVVNEAGTNVQLLRAGAPIALAPGTALEPGDEIVTGPGAQAVLLLENGRIEVIVFENTELTYSSIFLKLGEVYVRVKRKVDGWFVDSDHVAALPEDTGYFVRVGRNDEYTCEVLEGHVSVRSKASDWQPVTIGARQQLSARARSTPNRRSLNTTEYNALVNRVNKVQRVYRPGRAELMAPDLVGKTESDAQGVLSKQGFGRGVIVGVVTPNGNIGDVVAQSPLPGVFLRSNATMRLDVEVKPTIVPNLVGSNLVSARSRLERAKLELGKIEEQLEVGVESDIVRSQSEPARKKVAPGTKVDVVVTEKGARVPQLKGLSLGSARSVLGKADLALGDDTKRASTATVNTIIDQDPDAGDIVRANSDVDVVLAMKEVKYCIVPSVSGLSQSQAESRVRSAGFKYVTWEGQATSVGGTKPAARASHPCDSTVTIFTIEG